MSADPAGFALANPNRSGYSVIEATNWYAYVSNNPVRYVDPTGMWTYNGDGTFTAQAGDTLYDLYGDNWRELSGFGDRDPRTLQIGEKVGTPSLIQASQNEQVDDQAKVESFRKWSDISSTLGLISSGIATIATFTGGFPLAAVADATALVLNIKADMIEGEMSADTFIKAGNFILSSTALLSFPRYNLRSKQFHHIIGPNKGKFVSRHFVRILMGLFFGASLGSGITSKLLEDETDEQSSDEDSNDR